MPSDSSLLSKLLEGAAQVTGDARDRIIRTALDQVSDFGVRRFTVDELARRVGLSRVTIYRHFPSKHEVLEAALLHELRVFMTDVEAAVAPYETVEQRVVEGFIFSVAWLRAHGVLQRLLRTEPDLILPLLTTEGGPVLETGREFIASFARGGSHGDGVPLRSPQLDVLTDMLARLILSLVLTPDSVAPLETEAQLRDYAERYVGGITRAFMTTPFVG